MDVSIKPGAVFPTCRREVDVVVIIKCKHCERVFRIDQHLLPADGELQCRCPICKMDAVYSLQKKELVILAAARVY